MKADITSLVAQFPNARIAFLVFRDLAIPAERSLALDAEIAAEEQVTRGKYELDSVGKIPEIQVWRQAYKGFGIKSTSYRSSVERHLRNVLRERDLARINPFVDAYNFMSVKHLLPAGADDLGCVEGDIAFRISREGDSFIPLGGEDGVEDPPKPGEVVYADSGKVLCRRWNWYQDARSAVSSDTKNVVLTVQAGEVGDLDAAARETCAVITRECGGQAAFVVASRDVPVCILPLV